VLLALGGERSQIEGSIKYVTLNLISSAIFLSAIGFTYAMTGALNLARLAELIPHLSLEQKSLLAVLYLTAFGIKAGLFPLFFWLPASYHTPPASVSAIFAGLLTKVGVYTLIRFFTLLFNDLVFFDHVLLILACLTMLTGVLGAASQMEFRRILSFHIISQIGYMVLGLSLKTPLALLSSVFYITHHILVKTNLFLVSGLSHRLTGHYDLRRLGGLYRRYPILSLCFAISAFSLGGLPPLSGFFAKVLVIQAALETHHYWAAGLALFVGFLTLYSMTKIWSKGFWEKGQDFQEETLSTQLTPPTPGERRWMLLPMITLSLLTLSLGLGASKLYDYSQKVAEDLKNPQSYIQLVLYQNQSNGTKTNLQEE
ncbi:MAG: Na+/H+ antiporter subunit D, partial [Deltaproteobacteria bacterium]|nr:Na+/H+ antiporter subunit D [Deltaproteobacteria bacterium]